MGVSPSSDWADDVRARRSRGCAILFTPQSACLSELCALIGEQNRRTLALWALDLASETADALAERHPGDLRPRDAVDASSDWASGNVKMGVARRAILSCHAMAKEVDAEDAALCHAVAQACSVVHTPRHALGYPVYELTARVIRSGFEGFEDDVERRVSEYADRLAYRASRADQPRQWAGFMLG